MSGILLSPLVVNMFCPTGPGGGIDPTCGSKGVGGGKVEIWNYQDSPVANGYGKVRREIVNGKEFLVAPLTLIVPGVLNGSQGPLYYPPEEIARNYEDWNGVPMVVQHPTRNGIPVSGRTPQAMGSQEIGRVYSAKIGTEARLQAEGWFDVEATDRVDPSITPRLRKGEPIELSTGLYTTNIPNRGQYRGTVYTHIAKNYKPDHLAILPDRTGACSLRDGCGVLVNEEETTTMVTATPCTNCAENAMCSKCAAKAKVLNAMTCPKCGKTIPDGSMECECGYKVESEGEGGERDYPQRTTQEVENDCGGGSTSKKKKMKAMESAVTNLFQTNANPAQPRGERGRWDRAERVAIRDAIRKMFGDRDLTPIPAMADKPGTGTPTNPALGKPVSQTMSETELQSQEGDSSTATAEMDAEAESAHSVASVTGNLGAGMRTAVTTVANLFKTQRIKRKM